jgi:DNA-binding NarL/FixJ family response regulator
MDNDQVVTALICERRPRLAIGVTRVLEKSKQVRVVGRTDNPRKIVELVESLRPNVVVMNADRPGCNLLEICRTLKQDYSVGIVLLAFESRRGPVGEALAAGAHSIISWPFHPRDLLLSVVHAGRIARSVADLAELPEVETEMKANSDLDTGQLSPLMDWASRPPADEISPRLRPPKR